MDIKYTSLDCFPTPAITLVLATMQVQAEIRFSQQLKIVRNLPSAQLQRLKAEIEKEAVSEQSANFEALLLASPTSTKKQFDTIAKNGKAINKWRSK